MSSAVVVIKRSLRARKRNLFGSVSSVIVLKSGVWTRKRNFFV
jgi:hypothetical protein